MFQKKIVNGTALGESGCFLQANRNQKIEYQQEKDH